MGNEGFQQALSPFSASFLMGINLLGNIGDLALRIISGKWVFSLIHPMGDLLFL